MLNFAQKLVGPGQLVKVGAAQMTFVMQFLQRKQRAAGTQPALLSSIHTLQTLRQKFDVANTSMIELNVDGILLLAPGLQTAPLRADPLPRVQGGCNSVKIYVLRVDVSLYALDELAGHGPVSGGVPGLDQRLQLPIVCDARIVVQCVTQADRRFPLTALGTQSQVDAKDGAFRRRSRENVRQQLRLADEILPH